MLVILYTYPAGGRICKAEFYTVLISFGPLYLLDRYFLYLFPESQKFCTQVSSEENSGSAFYLSGAIKKETVMRVRMTVSNLKFRLRPCVESLAY